MDIKLHEGLRFVAKGKGKKIYRVLAVRPKKACILCEDTDKRTILSTSDQSVVNKLVAEVL